MLTARTLRSGAARALLLACLGGLAACQHAPSKPAPKAAAEPAAWRVSEQIGQILARAPAAADWSPLAAATELPAGIQVQTGSGAALILTRKGSQLVSGANSQFVLEDAGTVLQRGGTVRYRADEALRVEAGEVVIQASTSVFVVNRATGETVVAVEQGEVLTQRPNEPGRRLEAGQRFTFTATVMAAGEEVEPSPSPNRADPSGTTPTIVPAAAPHAAETPAAPNAKDQVADPPRAAGEASEASPPAPAEEVLDGPFARLVDGLLDGVAEARARPSGPQPSEGLGAEATTLSRPDA